MRSRPCRRCRWSPGRRDRCPRRSTTQVTRVARKVQRRTGHVRVGEPDAGTHPVVHTSPNDVDADVDTALSSRGVDVRVRARAGALRHRRRRAARRDARVARIERRRQVDAAAHVQRAQPPGPGRNMASRDCHHSRTRRGAGAARHRAGDRWRRRIPAPDRR